MRSPPSAASAIGAQHIAAVGVPRRMTVTCVRSADHFPKLTSPRVQPLPIAEMVTQPVVAVHDGTALVK
jgi:hypothetical protein